MSKNSAVIAIYMITYNHEKYISTAIQSVINQIVDQKFILIIGEDFSTDLTRSICLEFRKKYPDIIKLILHDKNVGAANNGKAVYDECIASGAKYLAPIEGDDYWTDPYKLQKQYDFLEANYEFVGCFHNTEERYEDSLLASRVYCNYPLARSFSFKDLCQGNLMPTCSLFFRSKYLKLLPLDNFNIECGDWALNLYNSQFGKFWYIPQLMGVHRLTSTSTWALQDQRTNELKVIFAYNEFLKIYKDIDQRKLLRKAKLRFVLSIKYKTLFKVLSMLKKCFQKI